MSSERQAIRAWQDHLEEAMDPDEADVIVDGWERRVSRQELDESQALQSEGFHAAMREQSDELHEALQHQSEEIVSQLRQEMESMGHQLAAAWRKDLLLVSVAQFFALAAAVGAVGALT